MYSSDDISGLNRPMIMPEIVGLADNGCNSDGGNSVVSNRRKDNMERYALAAYIPGHRPNLTDRMAPVGDEDSSNRYDCQTIEAPPSYSVNQ